MIINCARWYGRHTFGKWTTTETGEIRTTSYIGTVKASEARVVGRYFIQQRRQDGQI